MENDLYRLAAALKSIQGANWKIWTLAAIVFIGVFYWFR
jgi:hypothetical protein